MLLHLRKLDGRTGRWNTSGRGVASLAWGNRAADRAESEVSLPSKVRFLKRVLRHRFEHQPCFCPYCGLESSLRLLRRKKIVLNIMQCDDCGLIFRWPMDTPDDAEDYYQTQFTVKYPRGHLPYQAELDKLLAENFVGTPVDLNAKISLLKSLRPNAKVLDYGCSWGFGTYQLQHHGFDATGFEISKPRAAYARERVGVNVLDSFKALGDLPDGRFDVIFSNHVLEHLTGVRETFTTFSRLLAPGGLGFHCLPNFTGKVGREGMWIGEEHPLAPNTDFFTRTLPRHGFSRVLFGSTPLNPNIREELLAGKAQLDGYELLVVAYK
jgi:2-polyprenyl-3-methyl-5-hydroxy-6-metoxy-1,4-benzoquinol methylase